jgi:type I restriction enzyme S subunit
MITALKPYPAYKPSGVPWLGEVPEHWEVQPALAAYRPKQEKNAGMVEDTVLSLSYGRIVVKPQEKLHGLVPASFETYQIIEPGDIIVRTTDLQNDQNSLRIGHAGHRGIITSAYLCLKTTDRVSNAFGYQFLNAYDMLKIIYGFGSGLRQNLAFSDIKRMPVLIPPLSEQAAIVKFLDYADRRIRRYIRAKQKLIKLLEEQKQAIIHHAVTRGLDPAVRLKPSGVEWLGDVPEYWEVVSLRMRYSIQLGKMLDAKRITGAHLVPYLRNADVQWDTINTSDLPKMDILADEYARYTVHPGDLLVCEGGDVGRAAIWPGGDCATGYQKALHRLRPLKRERDDPHFLRLILYDTAKRGIFKADGSENTIAHLTAEKLRRYRFAFPPYKEQSAVVVDVGNQTATSEVASRRVEREIELIREYRTRLIADVVTGKLDVREAAANLPAKLEEPEPLDEAEVPEGDELDTDPAMEESADGDS